MRILCTINFYKIKTKLALSQYEKLHNFVFRMLSILKYQVFFSRHRVKVLIFEKCKESKKN